MKGLLLGAASAPLIIPLTISTDQDAGYNIKTAADAYLGGGGLTGAATINVTIAAGVRVRSMVCGALPAGCVVNLTNGGVIYGPGGNGANAAAGAGSAGGTALTLTTGVTIRIDNTGGYILGGGGGGGGGAELDGGGYTAKPGGGGGGAGGGTGGAGGGASTGAGFGDPATAGTAGALPSYFAGAWTNVSGSGAGRGAHGEGGTSTPIFGPNSGPVNGGDGGDGGGWGEAGGAGRQGTALAYGGQGAELLSAPGGAAGKAIDYNGASAPTWLGGNNSTQVRGATS